MVAAAFAGCAGNNANTNDTHMSTPAGGTTPMTMTPATTTTPTTPTSMGPTPPNCPKPAAGTGATSNQTSLTFTVTEPTATNPCYTINGPKSAPSGWLNVTFQNGGHEPHQIAFMALGNKTFDEFWTALRAPPGAGGMGMHEEDEPTPFGGPQAGPGGSTTAMLNLPAGDYVVVCFVPGMNGLPHAMSGMVAPFHVGNATSTLAEPAADLTIDLKDYNFTWSATPTKGNHTVRVNNLGPHHHEAVLVKLTGDKKAQDFIAAFDENATGPPPLAVLSGIAPMDVHQHGYFTVDLTPGNWALICFESDSDESPPHFVVGMIQDFTIA
ncbi:MAG TPA: hypothetical protein VM370_07700 [Candidatus Thermoplasmatota archaeon]|nr:hypothetical protein [Candidatus Thermoplasmatota archaeon]